METKSEESAQPSKAKCCLGALYFSQSRYDREKPPLCAGFAARLRPTDEPAEVPNDSVPGGEFKYICLGYSAWDEEALRRASRRRTSHSDAVQLPYCEGLEVLSAAAVAPRPELLTGGPEVENAARRATGNDHSADVRQRTGRVFTELGSPPDAEEWDRFKERFDRISKRMVDKMASNASYMVASLKKSWEQLMRDISGRKT